MIDNEDIVKLQSVCEFIHKEMKRLNERSAREKAEIRKCGADFSFGNPYGALYSAAQEFRNEMEETLESSLACKHEAYLLGETLLSPYFGRVDFTEDGCEREKYYIGVRALVDKDTYEILIYDWRAPMCSLFYMGETGRASYSAPCGEIEGCINGIRQYKFKDGELLYCWDTDLKIDDAVLREVLGAASSDKLKIIVSSIQREQNRAIRFPSDKSLCVCGPAGCGKTSVGMHRIAYILYEMRGRLCSDDVLLFTKNDAFLSHVSGILPELGEKEVRKERFSSLIKKLLPGIRVYDEYEQAESIMNGDSFRRESVGLVYSESFMKFLEGELDKIELRFSDIVLYDETIISATELVERCAGFFERLTVGGKLKLLTEWACEEIDRYFIRNREEIVRENTKRYDIYTPTEELFDNVRESVRRKAALMINACVPSDHIGIYIKLLSQYAPASALLADFRRRISLGNMLFENAVAVLFIAARLGKFAPPVQPRHILLDEAQDFCVMQHRILRLLYPKTVFTLLCDPNQALFPGEDTDDVATLTEIYSAQLLTLGKSYRSTAQIARYSKSFLENGSDYEVFERDGNEPHIIKCFDEAQQVADIISQLDERISSVCVITKTRAQAIELFGRLSGLTECTLVDGAEVSIASRVSVMPVMLTKGLEFDCVIIPYGDCLSQDKRTAYMMTTRALHELYVLEKA